ncbi:MAG TPA: ABC transporter permease [Bacteroidia bacterium]|nr:ABC transporter permease [Bacteroidia bacterium]HNT80351.1 ABC transporter permease [Bacteroidia bacterium]
MVSFLLKRIFYGFLILWGITTLVFYLFNILPGDPARMMLGQRADIASIEAINKELGRDYPMMKQYLFYLNDISPLSLHAVKNQESFTYYDANKYPSSSVLFNVNETALVLKKPYLRRSYQNQLTVNEMIADSLGGTAVLALAALIIAAFFGIVLGVYVSTRKGTIADRLILISSVFGMAFPSFFASILVAWIFGFVLSSYTHLNMTGSLYEVHPFKGEMLNIKNLILPAFTLGIRPLSVFMQLTRSSMLDELSKDYIRTALAKGLSKRTIVWKHALRNALGPVLTSISGWLGSLLAGAVFIEYIFGWKGIGKLMVDSLERYDFPVVMGCTLVVAVFFVIINILMDFIYALLDPRIRLN